MGANRNLIDYFQLAFDPFGAAVIGYTDDHNDFDGHSQVTRQISGPSINAELPGAENDSVPVPVEGSELGAAIASNMAGTNNAEAPLIVTPGPNGEQVTDFLHDAEVGLTSTPDVDSPVDILSIKYSSQDTRGGRLLTATMRVSDLQNFEPSSFWRMNFAANAPDSRDITNGVDTYSAADTDHSDQFFIPGASGCRGHQALRLRNCRAQWKWFDYLYRRRPRGSRQHRPRERYDFCLSQSGEDQCRAHSRGQATAEHHRQ